MEIWKNIKAVPDCDVSNFGSIRTWRARTHCAPTPVYPRTLKPSATKTGHKKIVLRYKSKKYTFSVHRLVLTAFLGECPNGMECCHNDGNPSNNHIENLRWDTTKNNVLDQVKHGIHAALKRKGEKHPLSKLKDLDVIEIRKRLVHGEMCTVLGKEYGVSRGTISHIKHGDTYRHLLLAEREKK